MEKNPNHWNSVLLNITLVKSLSVPLEPVTVAFLSTFSEKGFKGAAPPRPTSAVSIVPQYKRKTILYCHMNFPFSSAGGAARSGKAVKAAALYYRQRETNQPFSSKGSPWPSSALEKNPMHKQWNFSEVPHHRSRGAASTTYSWAVYAARLSARYQFDNMWQNTAEALQHSTCQMEFQR